MYVQGNGDGEAPGVVGGDEAEPAPEPVDGISSPVPSEDMDAIQNEPSTKSTAIAPTVDESEMLDAQLVEESQPEEESQLEEIADSDVLYTVEDKKQDFVPGEEVKPTTKGFQPLPSPDPKAVKALKTKLAALQKRAQDMTLSFVWLCLFWHNTYLFLIFKFQKSLSDIVFSCLLL